MIATLDHAHSGSSGAQNIRALRPLGAYLLKVQPPGSALPIPDVCPTCEDEWDGCFGGADNISRLKVHCVNQHVHEYRLTPDEVFEVELALFPRVFPNGTLPPPAS